MGTAFIALLFCFSFIQISFCRRCEKRQGKFLPAEGKDLFKPTHVIATFNAPSELACSQKCLHNDNCKYKKYDVGKKKCDLLESFSKEDLLGDDLLTRKETYSTAIEQNSACKSASKQRCGKGCIYTVKGTQKNSNTCDCREQGIYKDCKTALSVNNFQQAIYWIFPPSISNLMAVECMRDTDGTSLTMIHHDTEKATIVTGYERGGSYKRNIRYNLALESIVSIINQSSVCKQHTNITCYHVAIKNYIWIDDRRGQKLDFLGGGPSDGTGCKCGITNTCAAAGKKCNCDKNDSQWRMDEGYVTNKYVLPITAIYAGDNGDAKYNEELIYTVGPLICVF